MTILQRLHSATNVNLRVVDALIRRELVGRYGSSRLGYVWALFLPMMQIGVLYFLFSTIRSGRTDLPLLMFIVTGWVCYGFYTSMYGKVSAAADANRSLLMHPIVTRLDVLAGRAVLEILTAFALLAIYAFISIVLEGSGLPEDPLLVIVSFVTAGFFGLAVGMLFAALKTYFGQADLIMAPINRIGFFVSGILFLVTQLPSWTYEYLVWNPMIHPVEGMRQGWFTEYDSPILNLAYTWSIALPIFALSMVVERRSRKAIALG